MSTTIGQIDDLDEACRYIKARKRRMRIRGRELAAKFKPSAKKSLLNDVLAND